MSGVMEAEMDEARSPRSGAPSGEPEARREVRWSAGRKQELVLRLLRGESLDLLARESGQPAGRIAAWREEFLAGGHEGLKARPAPVEDLALREAQRKVGELSMEVDILLRAFARTYNESWLLERHGYRTPIEARHHLLPFQAALA